jgi:hypothetical protein
LGIEYNLMTIRFLATHSVDSSSQRNTRQHESLVFV